MLQGTALSVLALVSFIISFSSAHQKQLYSKTLISDQQEITIMYYFAFISKPL
jgi:hypothetical protein